MCYFSCHYWDGKGLRSLQQCASQLLGRWLFNLPFICICRYFFPLHMESNWKDTRYIELRASKTPLWGCSLHNTVWQVSLCQCFKLFQLQYNKNDRQSLLNRLLYSSIFCYVWAWKILALESCYTALYVLSAWLVLCLFPDPCVRTITFLLKASNFCNFIYELLLSCYRLIALFKVNGIYLF
jgi:hypothetical protein